MAIHGLIHRLIDWLIDWLTSRLFGRLIDWLIDCVILCVSELMVPFSVDFNFVFHADFFYCSIFGFSAFRAFSVISAGIMVNISVFAAPWSGKKVSAYLKQCTPVCAADVTVTSIGPVIFGKLFVHGLRSAQCRQRNSFDCQNGTVKVFVCCSTFAPLAVGIDLVRLDVFFHHDWKSLCF